MTSIRKRSLQAIVILMIWMFFTPLLFASDLDDGISKYTDGSVGKYDELGKEDKNIKFIKMNAKSKAKVHAQGGGDGVVSGQDGSGNMNSVLLAPGTNVQGDIIIIDESKGPKYNIVD